ncbi:uncharacterized protein LOC112146659 [Oryzias melastigma]|uniref:uncharacterized protein LOC112146659 n=1 Tax=Oryzias melastigma TaxID=30732 RepID=UPI000CF7BB4E|nr:uncharacterized protein LOC112146659 [Oryzias melastigma]
MATDLPSGSNGECSQASNLSDLCLRIMNICVFSDNIEFADVWIYIQIQWMTFNQIIVWFLDLYFDVLDQFQGQSSSIVQVLLQEDELKENQRHSRTRDGCWRPGAPEEVLGFWLTSSDSAGSAGPVRRSTPTSAVSASILVISGPVNPPFCCSPFSPSKAGPAHAERRVPAGKRMRNTNKTSSNVLIHKAPCKHPIMTAGVRVQAEISIDHYSPSRSNEPHLALAASYRRRIPPACQRAPDAPAGPGGVPERRSPRGEPECETRFLTQAGSD